MPRNGVKSSLPKLLLVSVALLMLSLVQSVVSAQETTPVTATLVQTIDTSKWNPSSPDPSDITYWPAQDLLLVVDGEVEEMGIYAGVNLFEATRSGELKGRGTTTPFSREPVGIDIAMHPTNDHLFISDDSQKRIFEVDRGRDGRIGTGDDSVTSFSTSAFGARDPEGITFGTLGGRVTLFIASGADSDVFRLDPGNDGLFNGVAPAGDDVASRFDVAVLGIADPEGIEFNPAAGTLYVLDRQNRLAEITTSGTLVRRIDIAHLNMRGPAGLTLAPSSNGTAGDNLYITARGVDNNVDPNENDGKIYEVRLTEQAPPPITGNQLLNPGFEVDSQPDGAPDWWSTHPRFTRSGEVVYEGSYAGKHASGSAVDYNIVQKVGNIQSGATYRFACRVNIPVDGDFVFKFQLLWRSASKSKISTQVLATYKSNTNNWHETAATVVAPTNAVSVDVRMLARRLDRTIYIDDCRFGQ